MSTRMSTKMKATIEVICYKWKKLKNEEYPLMMRVTKDGKRKYVSLGISVNPDHWDFIKGKPKPNCPNKDLILNIIDKKTMEYRKQLFEFQSIEKDFSAQKLVDTVNKPLKRKNVETPFPELIRELKSEKRIGNTTNTMGVRFRALRAIPKEASQKIMNFEVSKIIDFHTPLIALSKDVFLFSCLYCGINFIDIAYLKHSNIKGDRIVYSRHKTGKVINFPLQAHANTTIVIHNSGLISNYLRYGPFALF